VLVLAAPRSPWPSLPSPSLFSSSSLPLTMRATTVERDFPRATFACDVCDHTDAPAYRCFACLRGVLLLLAALPARVQATVLGLRGFDGAHDDRPVPSSSELPDDDGDDGDDGGGGGCGHDDFTSTQFRSSNFGGFGGKGATSGLSPDSFSRLAMLDDTFVRGNRCLRQEHLPCVCTRAHLRSPQEACCHPTCRH